MLLTWLQGHLDLNTLKYIGGIVMFLVVIISVRRGMSAEQDPQRLFSKSQKQQGHARAGNRCEMEVFPFIRCHRQSRHGDHWYPHSRGGATTMGNFVAACEKCNLSKSAKVPSRFATRRLESRRKGYFPPGVPVSTGERYNR